MPYNNQKKDLNAGAQIQKSQANVWAKLLIELLQAVPLHGGVDHSYPIFSVKISMQVNKCYARRGSFKLKDGTIIQPFDID